MHMHVPDPWQEEEEEEATKNICMYLAHICMYLTHVHVPGPWQRFEEEEATKNSTPAAAPA